MTDTKSSKAGFTVTNPDQPPFYLILAGRNLWAMQQLLRAGRKGCTPIKNPGTHARYVLRAKVEGGAT